MHRRELLRRGLVTAGAAALGPRLLRLGGLTSLGDVRPIAGVAATGVDVAAPPIITRAEWGADETLGTRARAFAPLVKAVVHHTAIDEVDPAAQVRGIQRVHTLSNGWADVGYNFLIDREGRIYEGRWARDYADGEAHSGEDLGGLLVEGAHAEGHNPGSLGVALLGTYSSPSSTVTEEAMSSLSRLIAWKFGPRDLDPRGADAYVLTAGATETFPNICGHRDIRSTGCPGDGLYARLPELRDRVAVDVQRGLVGFRILGADGSLWTYGASPTFATSGDIGDVRRSIGPGIPVRSAVGTPTGQGAWIADVKGGVYAFGDAPFAGSLGTRRLNRPILGMAATASGQGYWLVASDGGIFSFGDARFFGSTGAIRLNQPIVGMAAAPGGGGYWLVARDGGVFNFGSAPFLGSAVGRNGFVGPASSLAATPTGLGYWILDSTGSVHGFGDAPVFGGGVTAASRPALALVPVVRP